MSKFCPECGAENADDYRYCMACGKTIPDIDSEVEEQKEKIALNKKDKTNRFETFTFFLKRGLKVYSRMWQFYTGDMYALVLNGVWFGIFLLAILLIGFPFILSNFTIGIVFAIIPAFFVAWFVTIKVSDYLDMHGW